MTQLIDSLPDTELERLAQVLRNGSLVAFPTETVYGLGANASLSDSVQRIYQVKGRPSQDPLIVHCSSFDQTKLYVSEKASEWQRAAHEILGLRFWPGPLTLVLPVHSARIVSAVTAGTGWVGLRCPNHPLTLRFLALCDCPVAAPSANLFGHVSPTTAQHVFDDFPAVDNLWILDGGACGFGIESTVARINSDQTIDVLRRGGVSCEQIIEALQDAGLISKDANSAHGVVRVVERHVRTGSQLAAQVAPGQLLVHYAPLIPAKMITWEKGLDTMSYSQETSQAELKKTVVIDFNKHFLSLAPHVGAYKDVSQEGSSEEAAHELFAALRWAEGMAQGDSSDWRLWIFDPSIYPERQTDEIFLAVADRVFRAASGEKLRVEIIPNSGRVFSLVR